MFFGDAAFGGKGGKAMSGHERTDPAELAAVSPWGQGRVPRPHRVDRSAAQKASGTSGAASLCGPAPAAGERVPRAAPAPRMRLGRRLLQADPALCRRLGSRLLQADPALCRGLRKAIAASDPSALQEAGETLAASVGLRCAGEPGRRSLPAAPARRQSRLRSPERASGRLIRATCSAIGSTLSGCSSARWSEGWPMSCQRPPL